ncbi:MAG TPA: DUF167 domain-containing protein [Paracoccaceae bacterium]|nr:DUF167 domain-containing protein [Paracoccaceae bacterium]
MVGGAGLPWAELEDGLSLRVRLTPKGGRDAVEGLAEHAGLACLKVRVAAPPVEGAANQALCRLVAKSLGVARGAVTIEAGETGRVKRLRVVGEPALLAARLRGLLS